MLVVWRCMHARLVASGNVYRKVPHNFRTVGQLILSSMMGKKNLPVDRSDIFRNAMFNGVKGPAGVRWQKAWQRDTLAGRGFGAFSLSLKSAWWIPVNPPLIEIVVTAQLCKRTSRVLDLKMMQWLKNKNLDLYCHASQSRQCAWARNHSVGVGFAINCFVSKSGRFPTCQSPVRLLSIALKSWESMSWESMSSRFAMLESKPSRFASCCCCCCSSSSSSCSLSCSCCCGCAQILLWDP